MMYKNIAVAAILILSILSAGFTLTRDMDEDYTYVEYEVKGGDTLWEVCSKMNADADDDVRNSICLTQEKNNLKYDRQTLQPGEKILVAVKK